MKGMISIKRILINGAGRIGRCVFRNLWERGKSECTYINEPNMTIDNIIYLLKYDSIYGRFPGSVEKINETAFTVCDHKRTWQITCSSSTQLYDSKEFCDKADIVVDSTGNELCAQKSWEYIKKGIKNVIVTNTFYDADITCVMGHNDNKVNPELHKVISTSICDANAVVPLLSKLIPNIGIEYLFVTTLHPWLSYQNVMDSPVRMQRREGEICDYFPLGRSCINTLIPKTTTLGPVILHFFPELKNKLSYFSYRVPTQMVASAEISAVLDRSADNAEVEALFRQCDENIVTMNEDDIISIDCEKQPYSSIVDKRWLIADGKYLKLITWYDNEWGYCSRVTDLIERL